MTDGPIDLTLRASPDEMIAISGRLATEATHRGWLAGRSVLAGASGPVAAGLLAVWMGLDVQHAILFGAVGTTISLGVDMLASQVAGRRFAKILRTSDLRNRPTHARLSEEGLRIEARSMSWAGIPEVRPMDRATLLMFTPVDGFVIRDADLPEGVTPEDLRRRISGWKAA